MSVHTMGHDVGNPYSHVPHMSRWNTRRTISLDAWHQQLMILRRGLSIAARLMHTLANEHLLGL
jgi:hypothetical protein